MASKKIGIIIGPNGSGKGTLADKITQEFDYIHVSTRDLIHNWIRRNNASEYKQLIDNGHLINDKVVEDIVIEAFEIFNDEEIPPNIILDGLPRKVSQVGIVKQICDKFGYTVEWIIILNVTLEHTLDRIQNRVIGPNRKVYNLKYALPPSHFKAEELKKREDDKPEIAIRRYEDYMANTLPCLSDNLFLNSKVHTIDASKSIDEVYTDAEKFLSEIEVQA